MIRLLETRLIENVLLETYSVLSIVNRNIDSYNLHFLESICQLQHDED